MQGKRRVITIQNVEDDLWNKVQDFLLRNQRVPSISALAKAGLEQYLELADTYGIDKDWKVQLPAREREPSNDTVKTG